MRRMSLPLLAYPVLLSQKYVVLPQSPDALGALDLTPTSRVRGFRCPLSRFRPRPRPRLRLR